MHLMRVRSIQRVASKSSSVSILNVARRATTTAAASWSKPATSSARLAPSVHLHAAPSACLKVSIQSTCHQVSVARPLHPSGVHELREQMHGRGLA